MQAHSSAGSTDSGFAQPSAGEFTFFALIVKDVKLYFLLDATYSDPLGPQPFRPRTGAGKPLDFDDFGNEELGDDLLPE